jgi:hypothetical protein
MTPFAWLRSCFLLTALLFCGTAALGADRLQLFTGPEQSGQAQAGRDLARYVARAEGIDLAVSPTAGPVDTLLRLRDESTMAMALLPADVAAAYLGEAEHNADADQLLAPLRVIAPLYRETFYFVVRHDAPFDSVLDIRDARINLGPLRSSSALSVATLYGLLFDRPLADDRASFLSHEEALAKLITDRSVDVVAMVADRSTKLLAGMKPEARRFIKLLKFDSAAPGAAAALKVYEPTTVAAATYPNLLTEDLPALAVRLYWTVHGYRRGSDDARLTRLARAWCRNLARLKGEGQPQWQDVTAGAPVLRSGWLPARAAAREMALCLGTAGAELPAEGCSLRERVLGLCE